MQRIWTQTNEQVWGKRKHKGGSQRLEQPSQQDRPPKKKDQQTPNQSKDTTPKKEDQQTPSQSKDTTPKKEDQQTPSQSKDSTPKKPKEKDTRVKGGPDVSKTTTTKVNKDTAPDGSSVETREVESMDDHNEEFQETIRNKRKFRDDDSPMTPSAPKKERSNSKGKSKALP